MTTTTLELALLLRLRDEVSGGLKKVREEVSATGAATVKSTAAAAAATQAQTAVNRAAAAAVMDLAAKAAGAAVAVVALRRAEAGLGRDNGTAQAARLMLSYTKQVQAAEIAQMRLARAIAQSASIGGRLPPGGAFGSSAAAGGGPLLLGGPRGGGGMGGHGGVTDVPWRDISGPLLLGGPDVAASLGLWRRVRARLDGLGEKIAQSAATAGGWLRGGSSVAAGAAAAGYVVSKPLGASMDYNMRLAMMANTAFSDRDTAGRIAGKRELDAAIVGAVRHGGGTRDGAATALDAMLASGAFADTDKQKNAQYLAPVLRTVQRAATASGADAGDLANIGIRGMQTFKIGGGDVGRALDMAMAAGQSGGFELKDMSKWLPAQMANAKNIGMSGLGGFAKLVAVNQAAAITAGSRDEAGNNVVNLLAKINSQDTAKDAAKQGINLTGTLARARGKGMDGLDAFIGIVDKVVGKDAGYQAIQKKLKTAGNDGEKRELLESQADLLQGSAIGKIIQDRQAMMALVGIMGNRDYLSKVQHDVANGDGSIDKNYATIEQEAGFKTSQAKEEAAIASNVAFEKLAPVVGGVAEGMTGIAREYPLMTAAAVAATTALTALAAAAGASGVVGMLGRGGAAAAAGEAAAGVAGAVVTKPGLLAGAGKAVAGLATSAAGLSTAAVAGAGLAGYGVGSVINSSIEGTSTADAIGEAVARAMAALGSKEARQAVDVMVSIKDGQLTAEVNKTNDRDSRRR